jgi:hypothetical protein
MRPRQITRAAPSPRTAGNWTSISTAVSIERFVAADSISDVLMLSVIPECHDRRRQRGSGQA